jgi:hypothetical protein
LFEYLILRALDVRTATTQKYTEKSCLSRRDPIAAWTK